MFDKLFDWWAKNFFLDPLATLTALVGFLIFKVLGHRKNEVYIFSYYFLGYLLLKLITWVNDISLELTIRQNIERFADYIFTVFEFLIFYSFFKKTLSFKIYQRILSVLFFLFLSIGCGLLFYDIIVSGMVPESSISFLFNAQAFVLLVPCIFYFLEIFKSKPTSNLLRTPAFWVVTGLSFFMISTLPFSILLNSLWKNRQMVYYYGFDFFYLFYFILFLMIIRAYLCKPATAK